MKKEDTGWRDEWYSKWHREIKIDGREAWELMMWDIDAVEYRPNRGVVAFIELKTGQSELTEKQKEIYTWLSKCTGQPSFCVKYDRNLVAFSVENIVTREQYGVMDESEYIAWLQSL